MRLIVNILVFTALFISNQAIAASKLIFKDTNSQSQTLDGDSVPKGVHTLIQDIQQEQPDLHQIIVYKMDDHYVLYLLSGKIWEATKVRVDVDTSGEVLRIIDHYQGMEMKSEVLDDSASCPDKSVQFVVISAYPGVAQVNQSIAMVSEAAEKKYKTVMILDENADGPTYKSWFLCPNLKGFYTIGHGTQEGILVGNGDIVDFNFFSAKKFNNRYKDAAIIINSCLVYNYPFGTQMMFGNAMYASEIAENPGPNAYEYMGGHTSLLMYSSELSSACFIVKAIDGAKMDYDTLKECIDDKDIHYQNFGLSHPGRSL